MATLIAPPTSQPVRPPEPSRLITVAEYYQMMDDGGIGKNPRVELIHGRIVEKIPMNPPRKKAVRKLGNILVPLAAANGWLIDLQGPITTDDSEPEPDIAISRGPEGRYDTQHAGPADILLLVEVSDSTLYSDRKTKLALYAAAGVALYWIVNIPDACVEVYTGPEATGTYQSRTVYPRGEKVPLTIDGTTFTLAVSDILDGSP